MVQAAEAIFQHENPTNNLLRIDLHGLYVAEVKPSTTTRASPSAVYAGDGPSERAPAGANMPPCRAITAQNPQRVAPQVCSCSYRGQKLEIITGRGAHSKAAHDAHHLPHVTNTHPTAAMS